jgi:23S rRNA (adenine2503-C2)-methyltransferase
MKTSLLNYTENELVTLLQSFNEDPYRARQIFEALYHQGQKSFHEITTLSKNLRDMLDDQFTIRTMVKADETVSPYDKTTKFLWELADGHKIESVVIYERNRITFCISSQVGCALDCKFCATGKMGILRNLNVNEIIEQVLFMQEEINSKPGNIVYMGMGEPMLNYKNVIRSAEILTDPKGLGLGKRRITISTSGVLPGIINFTKENQPYSLAISLNSTEDAVREKIMPISKKYPISDLLKAAADYCSTSGKLITFEYVLIDNYNASLQDAKKLVQLTHQIPCKINVIPCNSNDPDYPPPSREKVREFELYVNARSRRITIRKRKGWEIQAACGQLYTKNLKLKKRALTTA